MFDSKLTIIEYTNKEDAKIIFNKALYYATERFNCIVSANDRELNYCCPSIYNSESIEEFIKVESKDYESLLILDSQFITLKDIKNVLSIIDNSTMHVVILFFRDVIKKLEPLGIYREIHLKKERELYSIKRLNNIISMYDETNSKNSIEEDIDEYLNKDLRKRYSDKVSASCFTSIFAYTTREESKINHTNIKGPESIEPIDHFIDSYRTRKDKINVAMGLKESPKSTMEDLKALSFSSVSKLTQEQREELKAIKNNKEAHPFVSPENDQPRVAFSKTQKSFKDSFTDEDLVCMFYFFKKVKASVGENIFKNLEGNSDNQKVINYLSKFV